MPHGLAIITVIYNNYIPLEDFVKTLSNQINKNFHVFVTDNSTTRKDFDHGGLEVTVTDSENNGYAAGINLGLKKAQEMGFDKFAIVNNDILFKENFVEKALSSLERNTDSIIGGKIYYAPGYEYHKDRYSPSDLGKVLWYAGGYVDWAHALPHHRGVDEVDKGQYDQEKQTDYVAGTLMLFDKSVLNKVGYWDESFFLYYEDADYNERAKRKGIKLMYDPSVVIWHKNAQSTGGAGSDLHVKYQEKNRVKFGLRYAPLKTKLHLLKNYFFTNRK